MLKCKHFTDKSRIGLQYYCNIEMLSFNCIDNEPKHWPTQRSGSNPHYLYIGTIIYDYTGKTADRFKYVINKYSITFIIIDF